jgi:DNA-binding transcriptional regulator YdaS (Cro superfamily)
MYNSGMTLMEYFKDEPQGAIKEMAEYIGVSATWMSLLIHNKRKASFKVAIKLERATQGLVTMQDLRPDLFG